MTELRDFTLQSARPLPVLLLADVSGSMSSDGKIEALNHATAEMLESFRQEEVGRAEIHLAVIAFGGATATVHLPLTAASQARWTDIAANGKTPLGTALDLATRMLDDRELIPGRAYRPTLILVSDGQPTDDWQEALGRLLSSERASKATRLAMGIGADADYDVLRQFAGGADGRLFEAQEARQIRQFFRWVTMSVTSRSRSGSPNAAPMPDMDLDDIDF